MTPAEAQARVQNNLPLIVTRHPVYVVKYTGYGGATRFDEKLAWVETESLATKIGDNLPQLGSLGTIQFFRLENPDEVEPRVPVFSSTFKPSDFVQSIDTLETLYGTILANLTEDQAALLLTIFVPRLGLEKAGENVEVPPPA